MEDSLWSQINQVLGIAFSKEPELCGELLDLDDLKSVTIEDNDG